MNALYQSLVEQALKHDGVEESTMMGSHCLRFRGAFFAMWFDREDALIVKLSADRVQTLIEEGEGEEFNFTKKRFKEWVLIPPGRSNHQQRIDEALEFARSSQ